MTKYGVNDLRKMFLDFFEVELSRNDFFVDAYLVDCLYELALATNASGGFTRNSRQLSGTEYPRRF